MAGLSECSNRRSMSGGPRGATRDGSSDGNAAPDDRLLVARFTVALAAWLLDHDTDSYYKISRAFVEGEPVGNLTRDHILDNITLYWLTGTAASAARSYWEDARALAAALASGQPPPAVTVPVGFTTFPGEIWASPRSWVEAVYPGLAYFNEADKGGHFAAWEEPELFTSELRAAFKSLR